MSVKQSIHRQINMNNVASQDSDSEQEMVKFREQYCESKIIIYD